MKVILLQFVLIPFALSAFSYARGAENRYDVWARTIAPISKLFVSSGPNRAARAEFTLEALTGAPPEVLGKRLNFAIQPPDRLRLSGEIMNQKITLCRDQQRVWAAPGRNFQTLLSNFGPLPKPEPGFAMGKFRVPFSMDQIGLLPALFIVQERTGEDVDGVPCRVLDLKLMPELAQNLKAQAWWARLWVTPDFKPARLRLAQPGWEIVLGIRNVKYLPVIPERQWRPIGESDVYFFNSDRLSQFMQLIKQKLNGGGW